MGFDLNQRPDGSDDQSKSQNSGSGVGCLMKGFLAGLFGMAVGVWLISGWASLAPVGRAGAIVLVALSILLMTPGIVMAGLKLLMWYWLRKARKAMTVLADIGGGLVTDLQKMYGRIHELRAARDEQFDGLDRDYYESATRQLASHGFRVLGDVVDQTLIDMGHPSPPIRVHVAADGTVMVAVYHVVMPNVPERLEGVKMYMCDVTTELSDGSFVCTANTEGLNLMTPPPKMHLRHFPLETPLMELVERHASELSDVLARNSGVKPVIIQTLSDAIESEKRQQAMKNAFRQEIGYVDPAEVKRIASASGADDETANVVADAADQARHVGRENGKDSR